MIHTASCQLKNAKPGQGDAGASMLHKQGHKSAAHTCSLRSRILPRSWCSLLPPSLKRYREGRHTRAMPPQTLRKSMPHHTTTTMGNQLLKPWPKMGTSLSALPIFLLKTVVCTQSQRQPQSQHKHS